ncbi:hypothetical protein O0L34_g3492 [Tuta absoluta]|nr:hypothetical protein O0L34_g3492 [Tuta absoluta]
MLTKQRFTRPDMEGRAKLNLFTLLLPLKVLLTACLPEAEYVMFKGFKFEDWTTLAPHITTTRAIKPSTPFSILSAKQWKLHQHGNTTVLPNQKITSECPESETPINIGPYEVPTDRDLVLHTMKTLHQLFASYHQKAMLFLDDVQKVVSATNKVIEKCSGDKVAYKQCVRNISNKCRRITKSFVITLEQQRHNIIQFEKKKICGLRDMKVDPVKLVKILASEEASMEFALPAFLRLLGSCNSLCSSPTQSNGKIKPTRHLTDTDVVVRHFLTKEGHKRLSPTKFFNRIYKIPIVHGNKRKL